jgi:hypothetical protein
MKKTKAKLIGITTTEAQDALRAEIERLREALMYKKFDYSSGVDAGRHLERKKTIERCAQMADNAIEAPGPMPDILHNVPVEDIVRASIRATKKEIAAAIRALKDEP